MDVYFEFKQLILVSERQQTWQHDWQLMCKITNNCWKKKTKYLKREKERETDIQQAINSQSFIHSYRVGNYWLIV